MFLPFVVLLMFTTVRGCLPYFKYSWKEKQAVFKNEQLAAQDCREFYRNYTDNATVVGLDEWRSLFALVLFCSRQCYLDCSEFWTKGYHLSRISHPVLKTTGIGNTPQEISMKCSCIFSTFVVSHNHSHDGHCLTNETNWNVFEEGYIDECLNNTSFGNGSTSTFTAFTQSYVFTSSTSTRSSIVTNSSRSQSTSISENVTTSISTPPNVETTTGSSSGVTITLGTPPAAPKKRVGT